MRKIIIKTTENTPHMNMGPDEDLVSFNYDKSFIALLIAINLITGLFLYHGFFLN